MTPATGELQRLRFLARVAEREARHLQSTDARLFAEPFSTARAQLLEADFDLAERVEAFVSRFSRLQDTLGDKLLPLLLRALGEAPAAAIDNLDRAERLGWIASADDWMATRRLRNQMIHEYIDDPVILADALQAGHDRVAMLLKTAAALRAELASRGWLAADHDS